jgi:hypothetical protein
MAWDVVFDNIDCTGDGKFGSIDSLYNSEIPYFADVNVKAMGMRAAVNVKVLDLFGDKLSANFVVNASNPSGTPALNLTANGKADLKNVHIDITKLDVAKNIITGTIFADISGKLPYAKVDLRSELINAETLMPPTKTSFVLPSFIGTANASEYVSDEPIPFDLLKFANADVKVFVKKLIVNEVITAGNVDLTAALKNGVLDVSPLTLNFGSGHVDITSTLNADNESLVLKLSSEGIVLQDFSKDFTQDNFGIVSGGQTHVSVNISGSGKTFRRLINNLSGPVIVIVDPSVVQSGNIKYFTNNVFIQVLNLLKINTTKQEEFDLKCAVVRADLQNGIMNFPRGIAIDSKKLTVVSNGTINLRNDKLDLSLNAYGEKTADVSVTQAVTGLIKISGTLQSPSMGIDTGGVVKTAASALLGGPIGVGANLLLDKDPAPCHTALQKTPFADHFEKPKGVVAATQGVYTGTGNAIDSGINAVTGIVGSGAGATKDAVKDAAKNIEKNVRDVRDSFKNLLKQ